MIGNQYRTGSSMKLHEALAVSECLQELTGISTLEQWFTPTRAIRNTLGKRFTLSRNDGTTYFLSERDLSELTSRSYRITNINLAIANNPFLKEILEADDWEAD